MSPERLRTVRRSITGLGLAGAAVVLLVLLAGVAHATSKKAMVPKPPPAGWAIAYYQYPGYWVMDAQGSGRTWVFQSFPYQGTDPLDLSPDGRSFVVCNRVLGQGQINLVDLYGDGTTLTQLIDGGSNSCVRWSPGPVLGTEEKILFCRLTAPDRQDICIVNPDPERPELQNLTEATDFAYPPKGLLAWSPDADAILSLASDESGDQLVVHHLALDADGRIFISGTTSVGRISGFYSSHMDWARTKTGEDKVAVDLSLDGTRNIYVLTLDLANGGYTMMQLTSPSDLRGAASKRHPAWSPDAAKIAFCVSGTGTSKADRNCCGIWVMDADGSNKTQLFSSGDVIDLALEPDWWAGAGQ
jgi:Tol biopolymer transport system component